MRLKAKVKMTVTAPRIGCSEEKPDHGTAAFVIDSDSHTRRDLTGFHWCWDPRFSNSQRVSKLLDAQETAERLWRAQEYFR